MTQWPSYSHSDNTIPLSQWDTVAILLSFWQHNTTIPMGHSGHPTVILTTQYHYPNGTQWPSYSHSDNTIPLSQWDTVTILQSFWQHNTTIPMGHSDHPTVILTTQYHYPNGTQWPSYCHSDNTIPLSQWDTVTILLSFWQHNTTIPE